MNTRIVTDSRFGKGESLDIADRRRTAAFLTSALDAGVDTLIVAGDDATLAALATVYFETLRGRAEPLTFVPMRAGSVTTVADWLEAPDAGGRGLRRVEKRLGTYRSRRIGTLRVVDSIDPEARLAFSFGMGSVVNLIDRAGRVRRRDAVRQAVGGDAVVEADVFVDWEQTAERFGYLLASSTPRSWANVAMGEACCVRVGNSALDLLRGATKLGRMFERVTGTPARDFQRVHIDTNSDYVLDGVIERSTRPRLVALSPGPQVRVLAP